MDIKHIRLRTIPHDGQRYATSGDYRLHEDVLEVTVSDMGDWRYAMLVGIHEAIEAILCKHACLSFEAIDRFDMLYEDAREKGRDFFPCGCDMSETSEPGDDIHAPYRAQHKYATIVEEFLAEKLSVDWAAYTRANLALYEQAKEA